MTDTHHDALQPREAVRTMLTAEQVLALIPVSRTTLFRMESEGRFPKGVYISGNRKIWFADEVIGWQNAVRLKGSRSRPPRGGGRPARKTG